MADTEAVTVDVDLVLIEVETIIVVDTVDVAQVLIEHAVVVILALVIKLDVVNIMRINLQDRTMSVTIVICTEIILGKIVSGMSTLRM